MYGIHFNNFVLFARICRWHGVAEHVKFRVVCIDDKITVVRLRPKLVATCALCSPLTTSEYSKIRSNNSRADKKYISYAVHGRRCWQMFRISFVRKVKRSNRKSKFSGFACVDAFSLHLFTRHTFDKSTVFYAIYDMQKSFVSVAAPKTKNQKRDDKIKLCVRQCNCYYYEIPMQKR